LGFRAYGIPIAADSPLGMVELTNNVDSFGGGCNPNLYASAAGANLDDGTASE